MSEPTILGADDLYETGEGIFYTRQALPVVDQTIVNLLKHTARTTPRRRARLCAHPTPDAEHHDMLIVSHRDTYVTPHRHARKSETFIVLEGLVTALLFNVDGSLQETIKMGPASSGRPFFYRMPPLKFHSLSIESELIVFIESTKGPFRAEDVENAPWAPGPNAIAAGRDFIASILAKAHVA